MPRLMLLRHAKAEVSRAGQPDLERKLSDRGRAEAARVGEYLAESALMPEHVLISSAQRTRETWEQILPMFARQPPFAYEPKLYDASASALLAVVRATAASVPSLMLIGHNPGIEELARQLVGSGENDARTRLAQTFPTAALAIIDFATGWSEIEPRSGRLDRLIVPRMLETEA